LRGICDTVYISTYVCTSEYMQCLKEACFSYFQLGGKCVAGPVALLSVWVLCTHFWIIIAINWHLFISWSYSLL